MIRIDIDMTAFKGSYSPGMELARILKSLGQWFEDKGLKAAAGRGFDIYDTNGDHVGKIRIGD